MRPANLPQLGLESSTTCRVAEVLLQCNCSGEGGEDGQHAQLQADVRAGQGALAEGLLGVGGWGGVSSNEEVSHT